MYTKDQRSKERNYWLNKLSGDLVKTGFPFDPHKTNQRKPGLESVSFSLTNQTFSRLMRLSNDSDIRLYIILMALLVLLLEKYTGNKDITVGAPIYRQDIEGDFVNKIVVLRNLLKDDMSFKELLLQVSQTNFEAMEHINYPLETIPYELNTSFPDNEFPLFDVAILLENLHDKSYIRHLNLNVIFSFTRKDNCIQGLVEYNNSLYRQETVKRMISHFNNLADRALTNIDSSLYNLHVMSDLEIKQLVKDVNATRVTAPGYPAGKMIHQLFQDQVNRTPKHIALQYEHRSLTYQELEDISNRLARRLFTCGVQGETIVAILLKSTMELIAAILAVLKSGGAYLPIDPEYLMSRINYMLEDSHTRHLITSKDLEDKLQLSHPHLTLFYVEDLELPQDIPASDNDDWLPQVPLDTNQSTHLAYVMYTSGSTGKPKGVMIHHSSVVNYVWWAVQTYVRDETLNFPLYSSISFDLTVTSIFTPLITGNTIVVYGGGESNFLIEEIIDENKVGIIKLTPSHLYLIKYKNLQHSNVKCFIVGGEIFETRIAREISDKFKGNIDIYNEYGPTEATVGCLIYKFNPTRDNYTSVPIGVPIAEAQTYLLDSNEQPVPIGVSGEIYVSGKGVARGYLNSPELSAEKFCLRQPGGRFLKKLPREASGTPRKNFLLNSSLYPYTPLPYYPIYKTGDLARWLPDGNLEFLGRVDQQVKIRGYRIELAEIEQKLLKHELIKEALVIARDAQEKSASDEKQDQYICAYLVSTAELQVSELREFLLQDLPDYMVPSFFVPLEAIPLTSNGKVNRKALPVPEIKKESNYVAPRNEKEKKLVNIWAKVLRIDRDVISIDASFFELGGQSLKQVDLISQIQKEFNVNISLAAIFERQTIQELSEYIKEAEIEEFISIKPVEEKEYYDLSSSQRRMYVISQLTPEKTLYNISRLVTLDREIHKEKLEKTIQLLIARHETLRTAFIIAAGTQVQKINKDTKLKIEYHDLEGKCELNTPSGRQQMKTIIRGFIRPFDFSRAPLFRVGLIKLETSKSILMFDIHHIVNDGVSMDIIFHDFTSLYEGKNLPPLRIQYKDYSQWQNSEKIKEKIKTQQDYWIKEFEEDIPVLNLPTDYPRPIVQSFEGSTVKFKIPRQTCTGLHRLAMEHEATLYMVFMAALNILLSKLSGQEDITIGTPVAGRRHADLDKIIGLFINTLVLKNYPRGKLKITAFLDEIKIKILKAFENQEYQFEDLLENVPVKRDISRNPMFDVMLSWFSLSRNREMESALGITSEESNDKSSYDYNRQLAKFDMLFHGIEYNGEVFFSLEYCTKLFKEETILRFVNNFKRIISVILTTPHLEISQIEILCQEEKKRILYDFNDTQRESPGDKALHQLFAEQVERNPDNIAVLETHQLHQEETSRLTPLSTTISITYKQLNEKSNQLAYFLIEKGIMVNNIVGFMVERSLEVMIGILGILKAGGAYLPIDPEYPEDRINYILADAKVKILIKKNNISRNFITADDIDVIFIDDAIDKNHPNATSIHPSALLLFYPSLPSNPAYIIYTSGSTGRPKGTLVSHCNVNNYATWFKTQLDITNEDRFSFTGSFCFDMAVTSTLVPLLSSAGIYTVRNKIDLVPREYLRHLAQHKISIIKLTPSQFNTLPEFIEDESLRFLRYIILGGEAVDVNHIRKYLAIYPHQSIVNEYGPTEATVATVFYVARRENIPEINPGEPNPSNLPIGQPIFNTRVYILDKYLELVPIGVRGELCIGGESVALGYLNKPELTADRFIQPQICTDLHRFTQESRPPYSPTQPLNHSPIYRTGDQVRWLNDGNIEFLGRIDSQVKIRGYRIEPEEIENQLLRHKEINDAVVSARKKEDSELYLCAYVVTQREFSAVELKEYLARKLPAYMIPSYFIHIEKIPLTPNGKIDQKVLQSLDINMKTGSEYVPPGNETEELIAAAWKEVLHNDNISVHDNFFDVGGHSLDIIRVNNKLTEIFQRDIPVVVMFRYATIRSLARYIDDKKTTEFISDEKIDDSLNIMEETTNFFLGDSDEIM